MFGAFHPVAGAPVSGSSSTSAGAIEPPAATVTSVAASPLAPTVVGGGTQQFSAAVSGTNSPAQSVTWSKIGLGTLSASGLYTAPAATSSVQTITITATSVADGSKTGSATVTVAAAVVAAPTVTAVAVSPSSTSLTGLSTQQFIAVVSGTMSPSQQVAWSISGAGALSATGLYTAPPAIESTQAATITATSVADVTKSTSATVTISAAPPSVPSGPTTRGPTGGGYKKRYRTWRIRPPSIQG